MAIAFWDVFFAVLTLVLLAVPAFILRKTNLLKTESIHVLTPILLYVCLPFLTITSLQNIEKSDEIIKNMLLTILISSVLLILLFFILKLILSKTKMEALTKGVYTNSLIFSNVGFMGIPFLQLLNLDEAIVYAASFMIVFNFLIWTLGAYATSGDKKYVSFKKALLNPTSIALVVALPLFLFGVNLAEIQPSIYRGISMLGEICTPLSMFILGIRMAEMNFKEIFCDLKSYVFVLVKLVIVPLIVYLTLYFLPIAEIVKMTIFIIFCMPTAALVLAFAENFSSDVNSATKMLLLSSVLSVVTIPILSLLI